MRNYKTLMCEQFVTVGVCSRGNGCTFAHGEGELRARDDPMTCKCCGGTFPPNGFTFRGSALGLCRACCLAGNPTAPTATATGAGAPAAGAPPAATGAPPLTPRMAICGTCKLSLPREGFSVRGYKVKVCRACRPNPGGAAPAPTPVPQLPTPAPAAVNASNVNIQCMACGEMTHPTGFSNRGLKRRQCATCTKKGQKPPQAPHHPRAPTAPPAPPANPAALPPPSLPQTQHPLPTPLPTAPPCSEEGEIEKLMLELERMKSINHTLLTGRPPFRFTPSPDEMKTHELGGGLSLTVISTRVNKDYFMEVQVRYHGEGGMVDVEAELQGERQTLSHVGPSGKSWRTLQVRDLEEVMQFNLLSMTPPSH